MKTLKEVITVLDGCFLKNRKEWCIENCPYLQNDEQMCRRDVLNDALHYLKEYRGDTDNFDYRIEISYPNGDLQRLRYPTIMVDRINCENGISLVMESLGFTNKVNPEGQVGWVKNGAVFASWEKVRIKDFNPPLTWQELQQMEGKPVFLEQYWYPMEDETGITEDEVETDKYWAVIDNVQTKRIHFVGKRLNMGMAKSDLNPNKNGGWQAYRKERNVD